MILLLGGTSEAAPIAKTLADEGYDVLLSMATAMPLRASFGARVERQNGMLDAQALAALIRTRNIRILVDASHPYAAAASANAWQACKETGVPYVAYERPPCLEEGPGIYWGADHEATSATACSFGKGVLLTIGSRHLSPYVAEARRRGVALQVRVLDQPASIEEARRAGLTLEQIVAANGPFSFEDNLALIARYRVGVLVTKDSGEAGGVPAKIAAARRAGCRIVAVRRPPRPHAGFRSVPALLQAVRMHLNSRLAGSFSHGPARFVLRK